MTLTAHMPLIERLRKAAMCVIFLDGSPEPAADVADMLRKAANEIERLRRIEDAARALRFSAYPAHGSGFVIAVTGGNIDTLRDAIGHEGTEIVRPCLSV
jgi:pilus assembly protein TadC